MSKLFFIKILALALFLTFNNIIVSQNSSFNFIDYLLYSYSFSSSDSKFMEMYAIGGLKEAKMYDICFTDNDALMNFSVRKKVYEKLLREIALQVDFDVTNLMEIYNRASFEDGDEHTIYVLKSFTLSTKLNIELTKFLSQYSNLKFIKNKNDYAKFLNKLKNIGRQVRKGKLNNFSRAITKLELILNIVDFSKSSIQIYSTSTLLNAIQFDLGIERLEYIKQHSGIKDDAFNQALNSVLSDLKNIPNEYWESIIQSLKINEKEIIDGSLAFANAVSNILILKGFNKFHWGAAVLFAIETYENIQDWQLELRKSAAAASLYVSLKDKNLDNDIALSVLEYAQYLFLKNMNSVMNNNWLKFWELFKPGQKQNRIFISDEFNTLRKIIIDRRFQEFAKTISIKNKNLTVGFIIDSSGSMRENDPLNSRISALSHIIDLLEGNENIFIIDFDDKATLINQNNWKDWNKFQLKRDINLINSDGGTDIGGGLNALKEALSSSEIESSNIGVLLISDGIGSYKNEAEWFIENNIPIYTISLVGNDNAALMQKIARETNGEYIKAKTANEIIAAFNKFYSKISGNATLICKKDYITLKETIEHSFFVDKRTDFLISSLSWSGSKISLELISPNGEVFSENGKDWSVGNNYIIAKINNPISGKWKARLFGEDIPKQKEPYSFEVLANTEFKINLIENKNSYSYSYNFEYDYNSLVKMTPKILLFNPQNRYQDISHTFKDNSFSFIPRDGKGNYQIEIQLEGLIDNERFERYYSKSIWVGEENLGFIGEVIELSGLHIIASLGKNNGNSKGIKCYIYEGLKSSNSTIIAEGVVTSVSDDKCFIEIKRNYIGRRIKIGDIVELDYKEWSRDN